MTDIPSHKPVLIVIAGPNGSGKTSVTSKILHHEWMEDAAYINPDIIAQEKFVLHIPPLMQHVLHVE